MIDQSKGLLLLLAAGIAGLLLIYYVYLRPWWQHHRSHHQLLVKYAKKHRGVFKSGPDKTPEPLSILSALGQSAFKSDRVDGTFLGKPFSFFYYELKFINYEKQRIEKFPFYFYQINLGVALPHLFFDNRKNSQDRSLKMLGKYLSANEQVELEGDFQNYFRLYHEKDSHLNTLGIMTPDNMESIIKNMPVFDVEFIGTRMNVIAKVQPLTQRDFDWFDKVMERFIKDVLPEILRTRHQPTGKMLTLLDPHKLK